MNGTVLGMSRKEVDTKFDEIVAFSEVEQFFDTPLKRYSNGMRLRLAFAVLVHLDPQIMVLDEIVMAGDLKFRQKSLTKLKEVTSDGRSMVVVSHFMEPIRYLCSRAVFLEYGVMKMAGPTDEVAEAYVESLQLRGEGGEADVVAEAQAKRRATEVAAASLALVEAHIPTKTSAKEETQSRARADAEERAKANAKAPVEQGREEPEPSAAQPQPLADRTDRVGNGAAKLIGIELWNADGVPVESVRTGQDVKVAVEYICLNGPVEGIGIHLSLFDTRGQAQFRCSNLYDDAPFHQLSGEGYMVCSIPALPLAPGTYTVELHCSTGHESEIADSVREAGKIEVVSGDDHGSGKLPKWEPTGVLVPHSWQVTNGREPAGSSSQAQDTD